VAVVLRPAVPADAAACGAVIHAAFEAIDRRHGFAPVFDTPEAAASTAALFIRLAALHGIVAEDDGAVTGVVFLDEGDPIRAIALVAVDPAAQSRGIGRRLMEAALERAGPAVGVRLVQEAFNGHAMALYASLGFAVKELLVSARGRPRHGPPAGTAVRAVTAADLDECAALHRRVHGVARTADLADGLELFTARAVVRAGRIVAVSYLFHGRGIAWGVAETDDDLHALVLALAAEAPGPVRFNLPVRDTGLLRWALAEGFRLERPLTLMARGWYQDPRGPWFPSGFY
jgi:ribosomal protein S18 acetylase RimI-like enzyme